MDVVKDKNKLITIIIFALCGIAITVSLAFAIVPTQVMKNHEEIINRTVFKFSNLSDIEGAKKKNAKVAGDIETIAGRTNNHKHRNNDTLPEDWNHFFEAYLYDLDVLYLHEDCDFASGKCKTEKDMNGDIMEGKIYIATGAVCQDDKIVAGEKNNVAVYTGLIPEGDEPSRFVCSSNN